MFLAVVSVFVMQVFSRATRVTSTGSLFKGETQPDNSSLKTLYDSFRQTVEDMTTQVYHLSDTIVYILIMFLVNIH